MTDAGVRQSTPERGANVWAPRAVALRYGNRSGQTGKLDDLI